MDNILCEDILTKLNTVLTQTEEDTRKKKDLIGEIIKNYISCDKTFMDSFIYFKNNIIT